MIEFYSETDFNIEDTKALSHWISKIILHENHELGDLTYVFCDDAYLHKLNVQFLNHDTLTDIISFDNSLGKQIHGEIYISVERVKENAGYLSGCLSRRVAPGYNSRSASFLRLQRQN